MSDAPRRVQQIEELDSIETCVPDRNSLCRLAALALYTRHFCARIHRCRNTEGTLCATLVKLHNQGSGQILFAIAPKDMDIDLLHRKKHPPNVQGWTCCGAFAENDIYYLEVCTLSEMCANSDELFSLEVGDPFHCQFDAEKYAALQKTLTQWD